MPYRSRNDGSMPFIIRTSTLRCSTHVVYIDNACTLIHLAFGKVLRTILWTRTLHATDLCNSNLIHFISIVGYTSMYLVKRTYTMHRAPLCARSRKRCQWQVLPSPVQYEETTTQTRNLPITGGKTLPLVPDPPFTSMYLVSLIIACLSILVCI